MLNALPEKVSARTGRSFLFISAHDYRSQRKANGHFIVRELAKRGTARFFSLGFSPISLVKRDPRASLWSRANRIENDAGVDCYLWRTAMHPINLQRAWLAGVERRWFERYARSIPDLLYRWAASADTIVVESGIGLLAVDGLRAANPDARLIYLCSDALDTIGCSDYLQEELRRVGGVFDGICIPSQRLAGEFAPNAPLYVVPHGMDAITRTGSASPYTGPLNLVSVGNMLFDPTFFALAAPALPDMTFHVIGGGRRAQGLSAPNIKVYGEMPFDRTLPYLEHADVGAAPYEGSKVSAYLADTSMKLMQYAAYGVPAVCPIEAAGDKYGRFGYTCGDRESIVQALRAALARGRGTASSPLSWAEVTDRILEPQAYADTQIR